MPKNAKRRFFFHQTRCCYISRSFQNRGVNNTCLDSDLSNLYCYFIFEYLFFHTRTSTTKIYSVMWFFLILFDSSRSSYRSFLFLCLFRLLLQLFLFQIFLLLCLFNSIKIGYQSFQLFLIELILSWIWITTNWLLLILFIVLLH